MSPFGDDRPKVSRWQVLEVIGEVPKNKNDTIRLSKVQFTPEGKPPVEYIQLQTWRHNPENDQDFPIKEQSIVFKPELAEKLAELLAKA